MSTFYGYFRSSAAYRCRIALNLKGLDYDFVPVHLRRGGGEQFQPAYRTLNPQELVPALEIDGGLLTQSLAIIEYLEETRPQPPLLPAEPAARAKVRAFALAIACEIHPLNNLRVLNYLRNELNQDEEAVARWYCHWVEKGLAQCQALLPAEPSPFCFGTEPSLADVCLIPQLANARRFTCDLAAVPRLLEIERRCFELSAFERARPEVQPDAE